MGTSRKPERIALQPALWWAVVVRGDLTCPICENDFCYEISSFQRFCRKCWRLKTSIIQGRCLDRDAWVQQRSHMLRQPLHGQRAQPSAWLLMVT